MVEHQLVLVFFGFDWILGGIFWGFVEFLSASANSLQCFHNFLFVLICGARKICFFLGIDENLFAI